MSSSQNRAIIPYKIDTGSDGNIIQIHIFRAWFTKDTKEQLAATKTISILQQTYNKSTVPQLGICHVTINHKKKKKLFQFFVVPRNGQALLSMPDIETLDIYTINCNRTCKHKYQYTNIPQETGKSDKCNIKTIGLSIQII